MPVLENKVAVITGGTRGFGLAMARAFAREGASVIVASRSAQTTQAAVDLLQAEKAKASGIPCDVSDLKHVQALAEHAIQVFGRFDVWINNAGNASVYGPTIHIQPEAFLLPIYTNVLGTYYGSLTAMRHFLARSSGKLINILGMGYRQPAPMQNAYGSSKAWILRFTQALAKEYNHDGIGIFAYAPGMMDTEMLLDVQVVTGYEDRLKVFPTIIRILSQPTEGPARKAVWLASSATDGRTGLVVKEMSYPKMLRNALREGIASLLHRPRRSVEIQIQSMPPAYPLKDE